MGTDGYHCTWVPLHVGTDGDHCMWVLMGTIARGY